MKGETIPEAELSVTVVVTSSFAKAIHPSAALLAEGLLRLRFLNLPRGTPVLIAHDSPRSVDGEWFPRDYLEYLGRVHHMLPRLRTCTGLAVVSMLRVGRSGLASNLAAAVRSVRTPFLLKVEHDHFFTRSVPLRAILDDMRNDPKLQFVRFNRRRNVAIRCDRGDYAAPGDRAAARRIWGKHVSTSATPLRCNYTRTACFSDMNHLARAAYYREIVLPLVTKAQDTMPETTMQPRIMDNWTRYGTFVFGAPGDPPCLVHADAAMRGHGELVPAITRWVRRVAASKHVEPPSAFECEEASEGGLIHAARRSMVGGGSFDLKSLQSHCALCAEASPAA